MIWVNSDLISDRWRTIMAWNYNDLTSAAGGAPRTFSQPTGYAFDAYGTRHVTYVGIDRHVHELWWNTSGWHHKDLTVAAGAPPGGSNTAIGYVLFCAQHVIYFGQFLDELGATMATTAAGIMSSWKVPLVSLSGRLVARLGTHSLAKAPST
jgi:hypothetical protein